MGGGDIVGGRSHLVMFSSGGSPHRSIIQNGPLLFCIPMGWRKLDGFGAATEGNVATQIWTLLTVTILFKMDRAEPSRIFRSKVGSPTPLGKLPPTPRPIRRGLTTSTTRCASKLFASDKIIL